VAKRFPIRQWEGREPAPRATAYWVEVKRQRQRRWEVIYRTNDLDRALAHAVKFARINTTLDVRVWDFHAMKAIWQGRGAEAKVEQWKERRPPGMTGANKNRRRARHNRREYVVATHRGVPVYISAAITDPDRAKALQRSIRQGGYAAIIISHDRLLAAQTKMQRGEKFRARSPYSRRNAGNGAGRRSARIYKYEGKHRVSARIRSRYEPSSEDVYWWKGGTATYVLVENPKGEYTYGGRRVDLVSIHGNGEIRWVSPAPDGGGTAAAVKHFGLQKAARPNRGRTRRNLHSAEERERLTMTISALRGEFRDAIATGRHQKARQIVGWFEGLAEAARVSEAPPFFVKRMLAIARQLERRIPEHSPRRKAGPPPEAWMNPRDLVKEAKATFGPKFWVRAGKDWEEGSHAVLWAGEGTFLADGTPAFDPDFYSDDPRYVMGVHKTVAAWSKKRGLHWEPYDRGTWHAYKSNPGRVRRNAGRACPNPTHRHRCARNIPRGWKKGKRGQYAKEREGHVAVVGPHMYLTGRFAYIVVRKSDGLRKAWGDSGTLGEVFRAAEAALPGGRSNPRRKARRTRHAGLSGLMGNSEIKRLERYA